MGVSVAYREPNGELTAFYLPLRHSNTGELQGQNYNLGVFLPLLQKGIDNCLINYFNAKFDLVSLSTLGLQTSRGRFVDSLVLAHLLDENLPTTGKSLDSCARHYLKDEKGKRKSEDLKQLTKNFGWGILTPNIISKYATWDAVLTHQLFEKLKPKLAAANLSEVWKHKADFLRLLIKMESTGILVDQYLCHEMAEIGHEEMDRIQNELGLNPASPKDLKRLLIEEMGLPERFHPKTGNATFDKDAMAWYEELLSELDDPTAQKVIEFRGWQKSVSSNYESYLKHVSPDGRLRPSFLQHGTTTGRLSCRDPNLQQIPRTGDKPWNGKMKSCFVPAPGYALVSIDYSQLELRLATVYAQEPTLIEAFQQDQDIFTQMASSLDMPRFNAKTLTYLTLYGGGTPRAMQALKLDHSKAKAAREKFFETYPRFKAASDRTSRIVENYGEIQLWSGRSRHFMYPQEEAHKAFNSLIQGGAADIVERALVRLDAEGFNDGDDSRILLQIHDEAVLEIKEDRIDEYLPAIADSMARINFHPKLETVKFKAVPGRWGNK